MESNLVKAFGDVVDRFPDHLALKGNGGKGKAYTYRDVRQHVRAVAGLLVRDPYASMPEIGILSENRPEWVISYLAVLAAGKTVVPIDANLKPNEILALIRYAGLGAIFVSDKLKPVLDGSDESVRLIPFETDAPDVSALSSDAASELDYVTDGNETAALIFTSGTTGKPKAVQLTHTNLLSNVQQAQASIHVRPDDVFLSVLPLHHTFEATAGFLLPLMTGAGIVYARSLKSKEIIEDIANNKVSLMCGVPLLFEKMYNSFRRKIAEAPLARRMLFRILFSLSSLGWTFGGHWGRNLFRSLRARAGLSSVRMFVSGGAALPPAISRFFNLIGFTFLQGYGLTECSPVVSVSRPEDIKFGSVGPPLANIDVRIDQPDSNGVGEIVVRGPNVTPGYRDNPEATAALIRDGWLFTGDLGRLSAGHLWITGRAKNVIVSAAGKNIYPEEIEEALLASDYILESVVFGRKKQDRHGEEVCATIVPDMEQFAARGLVGHTPDMNVVEQVIRNEVETINRQMADYKRIARFDIQVRELEKTSTKKIKRFIYNQ